MACIKEFVSRLSENDKIFVRFHKQKGEIINFVIQYCSKTTQGWREIIRYDTVHGYAHKDIYSCSKKRKTRREVLGEKEDYNLIFTQAYNDITKNWEKIKENFMFQ